MEGRVSMPSSHLPERASLEYLKQVAKERLQTTRQQDPHARLSAAQLAVARDHGFPSWRALKAEVDRRQAPARIPTSARPATTRFPSMLRRAAGTSSRGGRCSTRA